MFDGGLVFFTESFVFEQQVLFRIDICSVTSDPRVQWPRVGIEVKIYFHTTPIKESVVGLPDIHGIFLVYV